MTQKITSVNVEQSTLISLNGPTISNVSIANSTYVVLDDTAVSNAGGYAVITGNNFVSGAQVLFGSNAATSVTYVNSSTLRVQVPALTAGSYVVYVQNPDGSTAIRLNGITSSPIPVWATGSTLSSGQKDVLIAINLSATSDSSVVYSNTTSLPSGTSLLSNGYFYGTITGITDETTYNFTVVATDVENQDVSRSFSITITINDQYFKYTTMVVNGESFVNKTWVSDSSSDNLIATVFADSKPSAFNPYEIGWSNYFDGTGDYLTTTGASSFSLSTGDFTIECWVYANGFGGGNSGTIFVLDTTGTMYLRYQNTTTWAFFDGTIRRDYVFNDTNSAQNKWVHHAIVRNSGTLTWYINGTSVFSGSNSTNYAGTVLTLGEYPASSLNWYGYISNFRIVKGTALYTAAFTPPTSPLTAITNTSLLTCQSNRLIDNSTNNFTITRNGDVTVSNFSPFLETDVTLGSGYFDGTGDYLTFPNITLGSGDFTVEGWFYATQVADGRCAFSIGPTSGTIAFALLFNGTTQWRLVAYTPAGSAAFAAVNVSVSSYPAQSTWAHHAFVRNSGTFYWYINGVQVYTTSNSTDFTQVGATIGNWASVNPWQGYISNFRVVVGTAVYTSAFTPPTSSLTAVTNTKLLTLQSCLGENNKRFVDESGINSVITPSGDVTMGTYSPFSQTGWSAVFNGSADYLTTATSTSLSLGGGDYTVEFWCYSRSLGSGVAGAPYTLIDSTYRHLIRHNGAVWECYYKNGTAFTSVSTTTVPINQWVHHVLIRSGSTVKWYVNGVQRGSGTDATNYTTAAYIQIGNYGGYYYDGYVSNFRFVKGTALYDISGSTITVPTSTPTNVTSTAALLCTSYKHTDNSTANSGSGWGITITGAPSVQPYSPVAPSTTYTKSGVGGSMYCDGSGDFITLPSNFNYALGAVDFTFEFWINPSINTHSATWLINWNTEPRIQIDNRTLVLYSSGVARITSENILNAGTWTHVALVRSGTSIKMYADGVQTGSTYVASTNFAPQILDIGYTPFNGYLSGVRLIKSAIYTANFTPPTAPPTVQYLSSSNTSTLLLNFTNAGINDYTSKNNLGTVGDVRVVNSVKKFGNTSIYFDGTGDYLTSNPTNSDLYKFEDKDFTIEMFVRFNVVNSTQYLYDSRPDTTDGLYPTIYLGSNGTLRYYTNTGDRITSTALLVNTWYHVAVCRSGTSTKMFIDGTQVGSTYTDSHVYLNPTLRPRIGISGYSVASGLNGYIDDLRITKGYARYTSNFSAPTASFNLK